MHYTAHLGLLTSNPDIPVDAGEKSQPRRVRRVASVTAPVRFAPAMNTEILEIRDRRIEYRWVGSECGASGDLVLLHEGLGSTAMWKDFPDALSAATGCRTLVYSRLGYGRSSRLEGPRTVDFMHEEASEWLPALLRALNVHRPLLVGHSDGASIALIHGALPTTDISGIVAIAPHVFVEAFGLVSIRRAKSAYEANDLKTRLARYHDDVDSAFWGWNRAWLDPAFRAWTIEALLPSIRVPVVAIQGRDDEYGTLEQIERIRLALPSTEALILDQCGHSPHRDQPAAVIQATRAFLSRINPPTAAP